MYRLLPVFVTALIITLMLGFSAANTFANHSRVQTSVSKKNTSARIISPTPKESVLSVNARRRIARMKTQTPTITSTPTKSLSPVEAANVSLTDAQKFIMQAINDYRTSKGLQNVVADKYTCGFASIRAKEIVGAFNHDGFRSRVDSKSLHYKSYRSVTENIAMTADYKKVVDMWIGSSGHAENMRKDTPFVCVAKHDSYFAYEGLRL